MGCWKDTIVMHHLSPNGCSHAALLSLQVSHNGNVILIRSDIMLPAILGFLEAVPANACFIPPWRAPNKYKSLHEDPTVPGTRSMPGSIAS